MRRSDDKRRLVADVRNLRRVEHDVARILAETDRPVEAYEATLEAIGRPLGWRLGAVWELGSLTGRLHCVRIWHAERRDEEFEALSEDLALEPGEGRPGRVVMDGSPVWMVDAPADVNFPGGGSGSPQRPARRLRVSSARAPRPRWGDGVFRRGPARAGRAAARDHEGPGVPARPVRG